MKGRIRSVLLGLTLSWNAQANTCEAGNVRLQVLGSGGPELQDKRRSSSYLVWQGERAVVMVDTGPGSSVAFGESGARFVDLKAIALTHLHVDHSADLPAFVKGAFFTRRTRDLPVFGPEGNRLMPATTEFIQRLFGPQGAFPYLADNVDPALDGDFLVRAEDVPLQIKTPKKVFDLDDIGLTALPVHHGPVAAVAWRVDVGSCSIGFSGDMSNQRQHIVSLFKDADLLVMHNAVPQGVQGVARRLHMPPSAIGKIAQSANAGGVVLSHRMRRSLGREQATLKAITEHYQGPIAFADDGQQFTVGAQRP